jgi:hypothetical protein
MNHLSPPSSTLGPPFAALVVACDGETTAMLAGSVARQQSRSATLMRRSLDGAPCRISARGEAFEAANATHNSKVFPRRMTSFGRHMDETSFFDASLDVAPSACAASVRIMSRRGNPAGKGGLP